MLALAGNARIFLYQGVADLRRGFEGLAALVESSFNESLVSGAYFIFCNRRRDRVKVLYWDGDGLALWYKRLERGSFAKRKGESEQLDRRQLLMLLEGVTPQRLQKRHRVNLP